MSEGGYRPAERAAADGPGILCVLEDPDEQQLISGVLASAGYRVVTADSAAEGVVRLTNGRFSTVVWDTTLLDSARFERGRPVAVPNCPPLLFLVDCDLLPRFAAELRREAEDYVTRPLRSAEVLARVHALVRESVVARPAATRYADLALDDAVREALRGSRRLALTPAEYRLLRHLVVNAELVLSKEQISQRVWGEYRAGEAIEKLVSRLRLKVNREEPALIHTRRGFGYWLGSAERVDV